MPRLLYGASFPEGEDPDIEEYRQEIEKGRKMLEYDGPLWVDREAAKEILGLTEEEFAKKVRSGEILFTRNKWRIPDTLYFIGETSRSDGMNNDKY
jgi:hypothetical protein